MKTKLLSLVLAFVMILSMFSAMPITASAAEYTSTYYTYTLSNNQATITKVSSDLSGSVTIPSSLGGYTVVAIGSSAFSGNASITSVVIPSTVTTIGNYAFKNCSGITSLTIGNKVTSIGYEAFRYCTGLKSVSIPNSVTSIGNYAFRDCTRITSVTIGTGLSEIPERCFAGCTSLETVSIGTNVTKIGSSAFDACTALNTINWGSQLKTISSSAFYGCTSLTSVSIPNTVTVIDSSAFRNCSGITSLTIGNKVTSIGYEAFRYCTGLKSVSIPNSVTSIGNYAFRDCTRITSITIGTGLTEIPERCFAGCTSLETVSIGTNVTKIGSSAFDACTALSTINWGSSLKTISSSAFYGCTSLTSLTIPNTVTSIESSAFNSCSGLTKLIIGEKVTTIGYEAFKYCTGLKEVVIPENVTSIGGYAFRYCSNITKVYFPASLQTISSYAFNGCDSITDVYYESSESDWGYVTIENGNDPIKNATFHPNYTPTPADATKPTGSISSTNDVAYSQTVTLKLSDNAGVAGYYWGTSSAYSNNPYTSFIGWNGITSTNITTTETVSSAGTYYLVVRDTSGNLSPSYSITFYKTTFNANGGSITPPYVISKSSTAFTLPAATHTSYTFLGWATSSTATSAAYQPGGSFTTNANTTLYAVWKQGCNNGAHSYNYTATKSPTTSATGTLTGTCSKCSGTATVTLPKLNTADYSYAVRTAATCTMAGSGRYTWKTTTYGSFYFDVSISATGHNYSNGSCTHCGADDPNYVTSSASYEITDVTGTAGSTVDVYVSIVNNPGIISLRHTITYDTSALELISVQDCGLLEGYTTPSATISSPYTLRWADSLATQNNISNGRIVKLVFQIKDNVEAGSYNISVTPVEARNVNGAKVVFGEASASINVIDCIIGDTDGDGEVTDWDAIVLNRYLAGWNVTIEVAAADVDNDGEVTDWDAIILDRYLAGWNVTIG